MNLAYPLIIPCGGESLRMGELKGLLPYRGKPWLVYQMEQFAKVGGESICVVLGFSQEQFLSAMPWLSLAMNTYHLRDGLQISCVINPTPSLGPFSSLQCGARFLLTQKFSGAFFLPVDVPVPAAAVWQTMDRAVSKSTEAVIPRWNGKEGHPVWLSHSFLETLSRLPGDHPRARLDLQMAPLPTEQRRVVDVEDKQILMNLNTAEDFLAFHRDEQDTDKS